MKNLTDNQLLALAKNKDERAIEELLERYKYVAASVSRSYFLVGGANDDLLQEGMIGVFRAINTFDSEKAEFKTYVYTCVKSSIISSIKKHNTKKNQPLNAYISLSGYVDGDADKSLVIEDGRFRPEEMFIANESEIELFNDIKKVLSKNEFEIFKLYIQGYSYSDISIKVNKSQKSVDNSIQRLKKKVYVVLQNRK